MDDLNVVDASDDQLVHWLNQIATEQTRRRVMKDAEDTLIRVTQEYRAAAGLTPGSDWVQPTGALDAYPLGWTVNHNGQTWVSLTAFNVWEPGVANWRAETDDSGAPPEWVQPSGAADAYAKGDRVTYEGATYTSTIDGNVWSPADYPAGWQKDEGLN